MKALFVFALLLAASFAADPAHGETTLVPSVGGDKGTGETIMQTAAAGSVPTTCDGPQCPPPAAATPANPNLIPASVSGGVQPEIRENPKILQMKCKCGMSGCPCEDTVAPEIKENKTCTDPFCHQPLEHITPEIKHDDRIVPQLIGKFPEPCKDPHCKQEEHVEPEIKEKPCPCYKTVEPCDCLGPNNL